tara:strand:+ start:2330 stop:2779 length:450 start_codon:yes stop_codon:yes gene_type:complete
MKLRTLGEIFEHQQKLIKNTAKIEWLRSQDGMGLRWFVKLAHTDIKWGLPEGHPPFKQDKGPVGLSPSNLLRELRIFYLFFDVPENTTPQLRREQLFQQLLERLDASETELLLALKDGTFATQYRCPKKVVEEAFPGIFDAPLQLHFLR